jgi:multimeric flavodoxin WrbA
MNKILGVVGSPRRNGSTHLLVSAILDGAEAEGATTEMVFLDDLHIKECNGCYTCWKGKPCSKKDDMNRLYPKIIGSDVIVFGTPVYWYGPTALMKCFIDRFVYFNCPANRAKIRGKSAVIAVPFEEETLKTASLLVQFFQKSLDYLEMNLTARILVPGVSRRGDIMKKRNVLQKAYRLGTKLATIQ